jgi:tetratricopeptide (TPR) repeat protein
MAITLIAVVAISRAPAHAQVAGNRSAVDAAVALNRRGNELYRQGRYAEAVALLREAYRFKPEPVLQFNLARSCERMGNYACAIEAYETYLANANPSDRASVEAQLAECRARLAERMARVRLSLQSPPAQLVGRLPELPPGPSRSSRGARALVLAGVGVSGIAAGLGLMLVARSRYDDAVSDPTQTGAASKHERAESLMRAGNITLVAGGAVTAASILWWVFDDVSRRSGAREPVRTARAIQIGAGYVTLTA